MDLDVDEPAAVRRGERAAGHATCGLTAWLAVFAFALGQDDPIVAIGPAIANAVYDAIGVRFRHYPIRPERVLQALREKAAAKSTAAAATNESATNETAT